MFKYILGFVLISPLIGVYLMEQGAYAVDVGAIGYNNGAFNAFLLYFVLIVISYLFFQKVNIFTIRNSKSDDNELFGNSPYITFLGLNIIFLLVMLFGFGGINVILGTVQKGEFKANFGFFGPVTYFIFKYFSPVLLTYLAFDLRKVKHNRTKKIFFFLNIIIVLLLGLCWGTKSTSASMLVPFCIVYFWEVKWYKVALLFVVCIFLFMLTATLFDGRSLLDGGLDITDANANGAIAAVLYRMTVLQGCTAWYVWDLHQTGVPLAPYAPTLLAAFGDKFLSLFAGVDLSNLNEFAKYHFDLILTSSATGSNDARLTGHNITGTAFVDGVFIGGWYGIVFISIFAGFVAGQCYNVIYRAIKYNRPVIGSLACVYFFSYVFTWLNGGGIVVLFHISAVIGLLATWLFLRYVIKIKISAKNIFFPALKTI